MDRRPVVWALRRYSQKTVKKKSFFLMTKKHQNVVSFWTFFDNIGTAHDRRGKMVEQV